MDREIPGHCSRKMSPDFCAWHVWDTYWSVVAFSLFVALLCLLASFSIWIIENKRKNRLQREYNRVDEERTEDRRCFTGTRSLQNQLQQLAGENADLRNRLSEGMSAAMRHNNPGIADLSDMNRPTKLAEKFAELYDNQWTEACEVLLANKVPQPEKVLLDIVMFVFSECLNLRTNQNMSLKDAFALPNVQQNIPTTLKAKLEATRKEIGMTLMPEIKKFLTTRLESSEWSHLLIDDERITGYVEGCEELCWLMCNQDPPLSLSTECRDGTFDWTRYKAYMATGPYVAFVVWPVLLLHDGGPMLSKGVAEGCAERLVVYPRL